MSYVKNPPTTLPEAMARIKELEKKIDDLILAIDHGTVPAWLIVDGWQKTKEDKLHETGA